MRAWFLGFVFLVGCPHPLPQARRCVPPSISVTSLVVDPLCWWCDGGPSVFAVDNSQNDCSGVLTYRCDGHDGDLQARVNAHDVWSEIGELPDKDRVGTACWDVVWTPN